MTTVPSPEPVGADDAAADAARSRGDDLPSSVPDDDGVPVGSDDAAADAAAAGAAPQGTADDDV